MSLRYALLGIISKRRVTGYDVVHIFKQQMVHFWGSTHSQIYTELHKMEKDELVDHELVIQESSPNKKIYSLTDKGRKELIRWAVEEPLKSAKIKDEFLIKTTIFPILTHKEVLTLLDEVIERERITLEKTEAWRDHFKQESKQDLGALLTVEYGIRYAKMYIEWCQWAKQLIEERSLH
ncbi:PadR family transcriptional regulator [Shouchella miscanthi]|uniref:PadR family transcriptional regulator n=1 Tax=Shouchella miscanthi TaxID=2598861 RepID=A0ABU6NNE4_9BACI|nr:PadR family transcriptional regulator [Shouchella miscanthi]